MNIYRGCTHGCIYCDSRSEVYGKTYTFEDIEVKINAMELLENELRKKRKKCMIVTGAMTDSYMPLEKKLGYTRKCLEIIKQNGFGVALLTKSDLILRDIELLREINEESKCVVQMTLTTFDDELCKIVEPKVCNTKRRLQVLKEMNAAGIPTIVWLTPILPFINDSEENVMEILNACKEVGVKGILTFGAGMTLRYGNREYYYKKLDEYFPGLKKVYMKEYGSAYGIGSPNGSKLNRMVRTFCKKNDILCGHKAVFEYIFDFPQNDGQLSLFDIGKE